MTVLSRLIGLFGAVCYRLYVTTLQHTEPVHGSYGGDVVHVRWYGTTAERSSTPLILLNVQLSWKKRVYVQLSPAQAHNCGIAVNELVGKQCRSYGDVNILGLPMPRDFDTREYRARVPDSL